MKALLTNEIKHLCIIVQLGFADWDINERLANAIKRSPRFKRCEHVCKQYDSRFEAAKNLKVEMEPGFSWFYNLNKPKHKKHKKYNK